MSMNPNDPPGAAHDEAPQISPAPEDRAPEDSAPVDSAPVAPAPVDGRGLSITIVAFVVFIGTWIGAKIAASAFRSSGFEETEIGLAHTVLLLVAGAAAVIVGRNLKPIQRSVFVVITVFYFTLSAVAAIFTGSFADIEVESRFIAITSALIVLSDLIYPLIIAQVLAVTFSRLTLASDRAETDEDRAQKNETEVGRAEAEAVRSRVRRAGRSAATVLLVAAGVTIIVWFMSLPLTTEPLLWNAGNLLYFLAAAVGTVTAVVALHAVAAARSLPAPAPVIGRDPSRTRPRLSHTLTFLTVAAGLYQCMSLAVHALGADLNSPSSLYPTGSFTFFVFALGSLALAIVTFDAVTKPHAADPSE